MFLYFSLQLQIHKFKKGLTAFLLNHMMPELILYTDTSAFKIWLCLKL